MTNVYKQECSTKAKRETMAKKIQAVAESYGATWERSEFAANNPHELALTVVCGPWRFSIDFESKSNMECHFVSVYTDYRSNAVLPAGFGTELGIEVNSYHARKASIIEPNFEELELSIGVALRFLTTAIANGHDISNKPRFA